MERIVAQLENRVQTMTGNQAEAFELCVQTMLATRDMMRLGVPADMTVNMMVNGLRNGYSAADTKMLRQSFVSQARSSSVHQLAKSYAAGISRGETAQSVSKSSGGRRRRRWRRLAAVAAAVAAVAAAAGNRTYNARFSNKSKHIGREADAASRFFCPI